MSDVSKEAHSPPSNASFWDPGSYKRTTKRIEDGNKFATDLMALIQERADIEKSYAKSLKSWSEKWGEALNQGSEYGTMKSAFQIGVQTEAEKLSELHLSIRNDLQGEVIHKIRTWQKENYHKNTVMLTMTSLKERKAMEDLFKKAQKPWAKLLHKVEKSKNAYQNAHRNEKLVLHQQRNAAKDSLPSDMVKKLQYKGAKSIEEVLRTRTKYEGAIQDMNAYRPKYVEDMRRVFEKCQEGEGKRLNFLKEVLTSIHKCLNISGKKELGEIYEGFQKKISSVDEAEDLEWWARCHGVHMEFTWPRFEGPPPIKQKSSSGVKSVFYEVMKEEEVVQGSSKDQRNAEEVSNEPPETRARSKSSNGGRRKRNDFKEEIPITPVPVEALYSFEGSEEDELSFEKGEVFEKLEDEDEQGWSKGRKKDGKVGLYPANYVCKCC